MKLTQFVLASVTALVSALTCEAADFDGSKPFLCSTVDVASCASGDSCRRETLGSATGIPQFFTVDVGAKQMSEAGSSSSPWSAKIEHFDHDNKYQPSILILRGTSDDASGWVVTVNEATGKFIYAGIYRDGAPVVAFGACLARRLN